MAQEGKRSARTAVWCSLLVRSTEPRTTTIMRIPMLLSLKWLKQAWNRVSMTTSVRGKSATILEYFFQVCVCVLASFHSVNCLTQCFPDRLRPWRHVDQGQHGELGWGFVVPSQWGCGPLSTKVWHHTRPQTLGCTMWFGGVFSGGTMSHEWELPKMNVDQTWHRTPISYHSSTYTNVGGPVQQLESDMGWRKTYGYIWILNWQGIK